MKESFKKNLEMVYRKIDNGVLENVEIESILPCLYACLYVFYVTLDYPKETILDVIKIIIKSLDEYE